MLSPQAGGDGKVIKLGEVVMILDLHRQGLSVSAIAFQLGIDRKTVRKYLARGLEAPVYGPRQPRPRRIDPFVPYLRERVGAWPGLTGRRLFRELKECGYQGGYTAVTDALRKLRPPATPVFEVRFETSPGDQAQVDFAQFQVMFTDEPGITRIVWLFSLVLGYSRLLWARRSGSVNGGPPPLAPIGRLASGPADRAALPPRRLRGARRGAAPDPL
jgi:transposase